MVYPALLPLMRTPRLPAVDWTEAPAYLNGLVRFAERRNLVSARVPSHFNWPLTLVATCRSLYIPINYTTKMTVVILNTQHQILQFSAWHCWSTWWLNVLKYILSDALNACKPDQTVSWGRMIAWADIDFRRPLWPWRGKQYANPKYCHLPSRAGSITIQETSMWIFLLICFQRDATLRSLFIYGKLLYMFRVVSPPIRSTHNCIYSIWYLLTFWRRNYFF